jgi:hypothetical protein
MLASYLRYAHSISDVIVNMRSSRLCLITLLTLLVFACQVFKAYVNVQRRQWPKDNKKIVFFFAGLGLAQN